MRAVLHDLGENDLELDVLLGGVEIPAMRLVGIEYAPDSSSSSETSW